MVGNMHEYLEGVKRKIKEFGWIVQYVGGSDTDPGFAYTVGLCEKLRPEIILMGGFPPDISHSVVNRAAMSDEEQSDWATGRKVLQNHPVVFREVTPESARSRAKVAFRIYGPNTSIRLLQMFLPDKNGHFPWDVDCERQFRRQAVLSYVSESRA
jgi:hypothetical protein